MREQVLRQPNVTTPPCLGDSANAKLTTSINLLKQVYLATQPGQSWDLHTAAKRPDQIKMREYSMRAVRAN